MLGLIIGIVLVLVMAIAPILRLKAAMSDEDAGAPVEAVIIVLSDRRHDAAELKQVA